jgi:DNA-binding NarL/FixJ family response regulator
MVTSIAIIKDNPNLASGLACFLDSTGEFCVEAVYHRIGDAMGGLQQYPVDIVILDCYIQEHPSIRLIATLKSMGLKSKWLVYTVNDNEDIVFEALRAGANGYILKAADPIRLLEALRELVGGGAPLSPRITAKLLNHFQLLHGQESDQALLSQREKEILHLTSRGLLYKEIAKTLGIQRETVKKHLSKIYGKLNVNNKIEALNKFYGL